MTNSRLIYTLVTLLCISLLFSCAPELEPLQLNEQISSSDTERPPLSSLNEPGNSSTAIIQSSSSTQSLPISSPSSSSSTQPPTSSPAQSSASTQSPPISSPAQTAVGCKESNPKSGFTCAWDGYTTTTSLTPGRTLKPASYTLPSGCSSVTWKYAPDTDDFSLNYSCAQVPSAGFAALGSNNYVLFAELTCEDGKHTTACNPKTGWASKKGPELSGECKWNKNPTTTGRGGTPSGVTVVDPDKICASPTVVYKYSGGTWPTTGILPEWKNWDKKHTETYTDIEATVNNCPALESATVKCPPLVVNAGVDYIIELNCAGAGTSFEQCKGKIDAVLKPDECVDIYVLNYAGDARPAMLECNVNGNNGNANVRLNGSPKTINSYYGQLELTTLKSGENELGTLCLVSNGELTVKCRLSMR